ncbi:retrovirus-related Pol polyprotein from transposon 17.6 [Trichonephila inaurata madagascariensis]|uniref:Retrovirus-related Pol polyprotein from transposon 17.6 n=1 Tax=Trichonephila inaurata madagascariensis TaxID=2747483 RepID=A0A8X6Y9A9_9ARAC|nr:retrovirus-related Pol polyprotein from transposon 17.6 [Trichonephila inaurata madagascariensis]
MAYLAKARKDDLQTLATELGLEIGEMMRVIDFKNLILTSKDYDEQFTKTLLETIIETRVQAERDEKEENDYKRKQEGLILELERMKLSMTATSTNTSATAAEKINIQHLIPRFVENSDISTYLKIFERQCEQVNIGEVDYVTHLLPMLPIDISHIILLQKLDDYEIARGKTSNHKVLPDVRRTFFPSKINKQIGTRTVDKAKEEPRKSFRGHSQFESRNHLSCYGCGKPGYIKSKCPDCNPSKGDPAHYGILKVNSLSPSNRNAVLRISINGVSGTAFADSGASHSIAGATLYTILLQQGAAFETSISLSFADGLVTQKEVLRTFQTVLLEGRKFKTPFIILPDAKNNSTLLGVDFLENAGIVLNFRKNCWTFCDDSRKSYNFVTPYQSTSVNVRPVAINNCQLREDEGQELGSQRAELDSLLKNHHSIFEVGGEATPFIEHSINTENCVLNYL